MRFWPQQMKNCRSPDGLNSNWFVTLATAKPAGLTKTNRLPGDGCVAATPRRRRCARRHRRANTKTGHAVCPAGLATGRRWHNLATGRRRYSLRRRRRSYVRHARMMVRTISQLPTPNSQLLSQKMVTGRWAGTIFIEYGLCPKSPPPGSRLLFFDKRKFR